MSAVRAAFGRLDYFVVMPLLARVSWRLALWWGRRRGDLAFWWRREGREATIANLQHASHGALAAGTARQIARGVFRAQTCEEAETFAYERLATGGLGRVLRVEGTTHLAAAVAGGRGAIVFSMHYGSMCLAMIALARLGYRVNVLARSLAPEENPLSPIVRRYAERKVARLEATMGRPFILAGQEDTMLRVRRALRAGELLYILLSVPPELAHRRARVRFLGHPAELPCGIEVIAASTNAALVPFVVCREPDGYRHVLRFGAALAGPEAEPDLLQRCVDALEPEIWREPSQFFMWEYARSFWVPESHARTHATAETGGATPHARAS